MSDRARCQRGQAALLALVALAFAAVLAAGTVRLGVAVAQRESVQAAADAVALAGAADGPDAARRVAAANDVALLELDERGTDVIVLVARGDHRAEARARWRPRPIP